MIKQRILIIDIGINALYDYLTERTLHFLNCLTSVFCPHTYLCYH